MQPDGTARQIYQSDAGYVRVISAAFDGHYAWFALSKNHEGKLEFAILLVEPRTRKTWALGAEDGFAGLVPTPSRNAPTMPKVVVAPIAVGKAIMFGTGKGQRIGVAELGDRDAIRFRVIPISGEWDVRDLQPIRALSLWSEGQSMDSEAARVLVEYETPSPGWILIDPKSFDVTVLEADRYDHAYGLWQNGSYYYVKVLDRSSRRPPCALVRLDWSAANPELLLEGVVGDCSHRPRRRRLRRGWRFRRTRNCWPAGASSTCMSGTPPRGRRNAPFDATRTAGSAASHPTEDGFSCRKTARLP